MAQTFKFRVANVGYLLGLSTIGNKEINHTGIRDYVGITFPYSLLRTNESRLAAAACT